MLVVVVVVLLGKVSSEPRDDDLMPYCVDTGPTNCIQI